jgi:hypothetical protein
VTDSNMRVISATDRDAILNDVIAVYAQQGWTISGVLSGQAIAQRRVPVGGYKTWISVIFWFASIVLTLITGGLFLIVIGIMYLTRATDTTVITVDEHGEVRFR